MERLEHKDCKNYRDTMGIRHCFREFPWSCIRTQKEGLCPEYPLDDVETGLTDSD